MYLGSDRMTDTSGTRFLALHACVSVNWKTVNAKQSISDINQFFPFLFELTANANHTKKDSIQNSKKVKQQM